MDSILHIEYQNSNLIGKDGTCLRSLLILILMIERQYLKLPLTTLKECKIASLNAQHMEP